MREKYVQAFKLLNLEPQADKDVVRRAYKKRIQQLHPDRDVENTTPERKQEFQDVLNAYKLISDAIKEGELARLEADKQREQHAQTDNPSQDDAPRPVTANPELRRHMATDALYGSGSPTSAVKFVAGVILVAALLVLGFVAFAAWQKSTSPTRQWDPTYHENRVRGINPDNT